MFFIPFPLLGSSVAEQVTVNHLVVGSTPTRAAILHKDLRVIRESLFFCLVVYLSDKRDFIPILRRSPLA